MNYTSLFSQPLYRPAALLGLWCVCAMTGPAALAQVTRCVDATTGKVSYTDGACAKGANATEIERRKTDEELAQERAREQEALQAKAERREQEHAQRRLQADERAEQAAQRATSRSAAGSQPAQSAACLQSRERYRAASDAAADKTMGSSVQLDAAKRQMELDCLGPEAYSRLEASRPAPTVVLPSDPYADRYPYYRPPPPRPPVQPTPAPSIARCDVFKCVDTQGYTHPRGQIGETVRPPSPSANPRSCRSQGGNAPC